MGRKGQAGVKQAPRVARAAREALNEQYPQPRTPVIRAQGNVQPKPLVIPLYDASLIQRGIAEQSPFVSPGRFRVDGCRESRDTARRED
jgi:hypothetical protein